MIDSVPPVSADQLISEFRHGEMVLLVLGQSDGEQTAVVAMAAEYCEADHVTFMARQARGLVSLALTEERCEQLNLPPMVLLHMVHGQSTNVRSNAKSYRQSNRIS